MTETGVVDFTERRELHNNPIIGLGRLVVLSRNGLVKVFVLLGRNSLFIIVVREFGISLASSP